MTSQLNCARTVIAAAPVWLLSFSAFAIENETASDTEVPAHSIVLRVSEETLKSLLGDERVDRQAAIRDVILGTSIRGTARITGEPGVSLIDSADQARFCITFDGAAHSRTTGHNGPGIIYSHSVTTFTATKPIVFEPGKGFAGLPTQVTVRTRTFVDGIDSTRGGLIGSIIRRRATKIEAAQHAQANAIAESKAKRRIIEEFEKNCEQQLATLNRIADLRSVALTALRPTGSAEARYTCCTTPRYLQFATRFGDSDTPINLPAIATEDGRGAAIEIWVHESFMDGRIVTALELFGTQVKSTDFLKVFTATSRVLGGRTNLGGQVQSMVADHFRIHTVGKWRVIEMATPADKSPAVARAPRSARR